MARGDSGPDSQGGRGLAEAAGGHFSGRFWVLSSWSSDDEMESSTQSLRAAVYLPDTGGGARLKGKEGFRSGQLRRW
jgi:hypothetical protein